jgi:hypothetical protein
VSATLGELIGREMLSRPDVSLWSLKNSNNRAVFVSLRRVWAVANTGDCIPRHLKSCNTADQLSALARYSSSNGDGWRGSR